MKFAHIADCHVGSWRDVELRDINYEYFSSTIDAIISENVDCVFIAGDLFNTAVPSIDALKLVTEKLKLLSENNIPVYGIAGSHDYSASGKSMLDVLTKAGLFIPVIQGNIENGLLTLEPVKGPKGISVSGLAGKRGSLEKDSYKTTNYAKLEESENLFFLFHTTINEYSPKKEMEGISVNLLPKNVKYYAGGHVHYHFETKTLSSTLCYPGPTCPNNFAEWEDLEKGSYVIGTFENGEINILRKFIETYPVKKINYDVTDKTAIEIQEELLQKVENNTNAIILLRLTGIKKESLSDVNFSKIDSHAKQTGAKAILRNSAGVLKEETEESTKVVTDIHKTEIEKIKESLEKSRLQDKSLSRIENSKEERIILQLMQTLSIDKKEGETATDFDQRVSEEVSKILSHEL